MLTRLWSWCRRVWSKFTSQSETPIQARLYVAHLIFGLLLLWLFDVPRQNDLAFIGLLFGLLGAGTLYWESSADADDFKKVARDMIAQFHGPRAALFQKGPKVIMWIAITYLIATLLLSNAPLVGAILEQDEDRLHLVASLGLRLLVSVILVAIVYSLFVVPQWIMKRQSDNLTALPDEDWVPYVKRALRRIGFGSLYLAGVMQLPALVCPS